MKTLLPCLLLLVLLTAGSTAAQDCTDALSGTWEMVSQTLVYPDSTVDRGQTLQRSLKILNGTHFAFGRQNPGGEDIFGGGGRYEVTGGNTYTEHIEFHSDPVLVGSSITFACRMEDGMWHHTGQIGNFRLEEVWAPVE